jgi:hypothetical protein
MPLHGDLARSLTPPTSVADNNISHSPTFFRIKIRPRSLFPSLIADPHVCPPVRSRASAPFFLLTYNHVSMAGGERGRKKMRPEKYGSVGGRGVEARRGPRRQLLTLPPSSSLRSLPRAPCTSPSSRIRWLRPRVSVKENNVNSNDNAAVECNSLKRIAQTPAIRKTRKTVTSKTRIAGGGEKRWGGRAGRGGRGEGGRGEYPIKMAISLPWRI